MTEQRFSYNPDSPVSKLAADMSYDWNAFKSELYKARSASGLTVEDVAERTGWAVEKVREFEAYWSEPRRQEIQLYALCIGARVSYSLEPGVVHPNELP